MNTTYPDKFSKATGAAPTPDEARDFVINHWGNGGVDEAALNSVAEMMVLVVELFGDDYRKQRPDESVFWHNFRVANDVYQNWDGSGRERLIATFVALAHDICEDKKNYTPEGLATLWCQAEYKAAGVEQKAEIAAERDAEKCAITLAIAYKTDNRDDDLVATCKDGRRAQQHNRAEQAAEELSNVACHLAWRVYPAVMVADKTDNLVADRQDFQAGKLKFVNQNKFYEWAFKKISDRAIIAALPLAETRQEQFFAQHNQLFTDILLSEDKSPFPSGSYDRYFAKKLADDLRRAQTTTSAIQQKVRTNDVIGYVLGFAATAQQVTDSLFRENQRMQTTPCFVSRSDALRAAFYATAEEIITQAAPLPYGLKQSNRLATHQYHTTLLRAGSYAPSVIIAAIPKTPTL